MLRLKEMEHGSERRAKVVAQDIAGLREEGRLERQKQKSLLKEKEVSQIDLHVVGLFSYIYMYFVIQSVAGVIYVTSKDFFLHYFLVSTFACAMSHTAVI